MSVAYKEEIHRLVDDIPDDDPEIGRRLLAVFTLLLAAVADDELTTRRLIALVEDGRIRVANPESLTFALEALGRNHRPSEPDALWRLLDAAPEDDEPLTPEESAMLDERQAAVALGRTVPHDEVLRRLRA